jgi:hypothetical protein
VVKLQDDLMTAAPYGVVMIREAVVDPAEFEAAASRLCSSAVGILMRRRPLP